MSETPLPDLAALIRSRRARPLLALSRDPAPFRAAAQAETRRRRADRRCAAVATMRRRFAERGLGLDDVAREVGVSGRTLQLIFFEIGTGFEEAMTAIRMERARDLLLLCEDPGKVAEQLGRHPNHLASQFADTFGVTPSVLVRGLRAGRRYEERRLADLPESARSLEVRRRQMGSDAATVLAVGDAIMSSPAVSVGG
jgi:AraC-like DNA-binding protein